MKNQPLVGILMGSASDYPIMKNCEEILDELGVRYETFILSAHRTPREARKYTETAKRRGVKVIIAGAGAAAHLAGAVASHTTIPVIGVPLESKALKGLDALFSTVQMPAGIPVACMAIGTAGAKNAALLAAQILGTSNPSVERKLLKRRLRERKKIIASNKSALKRLLSSVSAP